MTKSRVYFSHTITDDTMSYRRGRQPVQSTASVDLVPATSTEGDAPYSTSPYIPPFRTVDIHPLIPATLDIHPLLKAHANPDFFFDLALPEFVPVHLFGGRPTRLSQIVLSQLATYSDITSLRIICRYFPLAINVAPRQPSTAITVADVLSAIHRAMRTPVSENDWNRLPPSRQEMVSSAFFRRCGLSASEKAKGLRWVDLLAGSTAFGGLARSGIADGSMELFTIRPSVHFNVEEILHPSQSNNVTRPLELHNITDQLEAPPPVEDDLELDEEDGFEDELDEAAFVICRPKGQGTLSSR